MSYSYVTYTGDGTTQDYIVPFPYLKISDVKVSLDEAEQNALAYSWHTSGTIRFVTAPPNGASIRIQRITDKVTPAVDFRDGSTLALRPLYAAWPLLSLCAGKTLWPFLSHRTLWPNGASGDIQGHLSGREIIFAATGRGGGLLHVDPHLAEVVDLDLCLGEYLFDFLEDFLSLVLCGDGGFPVEGVVGFLCDVEELRHREIKVGLGMGCGHHKHPERRPLRRPERGQQVLWPRFPPRHMAPVHRFRHGD